MIKIEVTGNSIGEVADKLLAIGANLRGSAIVEGARAAVNAMQAMGVAEAAPVDPTPAPKSAPLADASDSQPTTTEPSSTPAPAAELNFDIDVAPHVLQVVKEKGKPVAQEILSQFGVEKASLLDPTLWPELVDQLKAAL